MKRILAKAGSKKIAGIALIFATLLVGIGVISNFSDDSHKIANNAALSQFNDNAFNPFASNSGSSRAALERQMQAQNSNTARFMQGKDGQDADEDEAYSSDGAYAEGVNAEEGFVYGDNAEPIYSVQATVDEYGNPIVRNGAGADSAMQGGTLRGPSFGAGAGAASEGEEGEGAASAQAQKKGLKNKNKIKNVKQTSLNKLGNSGKSSPSWGGSSGGSSAGGSMANIDTGAFKDNGSRALPQNNIASIDDKAGDLSAFKMGRGGAMGGFNVARANGGSSGNRGGKGGDMSAGNDLLNAKYYSQKAVISQTVERSKEAVQAAFDGSDEPLGSTIETGATIQTVANNLGAGMDGNDIPDASGFGGVEAPPPFQDQQDDLDEIDRLKSKLLNKYLALYGASLGMSFLIWLLMRSSNVYAYYSALALAIINIIFINAMLWGDIRDIIMKMDTIAKRSSQNINYGWKVTFFFTSFTVLTAVNIMALASKITNVVTAIEKAGTESGFKGIAQGILKGLGKFTKWLGFTGA